MRRAGVDSPLSQNLVDDLPHPPGRQPLVARNLLIGPAVAEPPKMRLRRKALSCALSRGVLGSGMIACSMLPRWLPPFSTGSLKNRMITRFLEKGKKMALFFVRSLQRS